MESVRLGMALLRLVTDDAEAVEGGGLPRGAARAARQSWSGAGRESGADQEPVGGGWGRSASAVAIRRAGNGAP